MTFGRNEQFETDLDDQPESDIALKARNFTWPDKFSKSERAPIVREIARLRKEQGVTQAKLDKLCGFNPGITACIESNTRALDKVTLKKIGHFLRSDFNEVVYIACQPIKLSSGLSAIALPNSLDISYERIHKVKVEDLDFKIQFNNGEYTLDISTLGQIVISHTGKLNESDLLQQAFTYIAKLIKKGE